MRQWCILREGCCVSRINSDDTTPVESIMLTDI